MHIPCNYEIQENSNSMSGPRVSIVIDDISSLPAALRRLAEMGHDMTPSLEALQEACEEQRKRKALEAAIADLTKKSEKA